MRDEGRGDDGLWAVGGGARWDLEVTDKQTNKQTNKQTTTNQQNLHRHIVMLPDAGQEE